MTFVFTLQSKLVRLGVVVGALLVGGLLLMMIQAHFVIRVLADPRFTVNRELLNLAIVQFPNSTRVNLELGKSELSGAPDYQSAVKHASRAVELTPKDYQGWHLLGMAQDALGNQEAAEQALAQALKLAPTNGKANWAAANVALRGGKLTEALERLRIAAAGDASLLPLALDLVWQASGRDVELVKSLAAGRASAQWALARFFTEQALFEEAAQAFQSLDREQRLTDPRGAAFITQLISAKQFATARALWLDLVAPQQSAEAARELLWNGGFEWDAPRNFEHFNWVLGRSDYARIGLDRRQAHEGARSLRIVFAGRDTTKLNDEIQQLLALRPGAAYELECYVKTEELVTPEGPRVALFHGGTLLAASEPAPSGTTEWQRLTVSFTVPADNETLSVRIVRRPKFSYDEPTNGAVWFDDFKLHCTSGC